LIGTWLIGWLLKTLQRLLPRRKHPTVLQSHITRLARVGRLRRWRPHSALYLTQPRHHPREKLRHQNSQIDRFDGIISVRRRFVGAPCSADKVCFYLF
jgi:hypothetical protein